MRKGKRYKEEKINKCKITITVFLILLLIFFIFENIIEEEITVEVLEETVEVSVEVEQAEEVEEIIEEEDENIKLYISEQMEKNNLTEDNFSFFYYNTDTKKYYFFNENKWFTAGSTAKVPIAMMYYDQLNAGLIELDTTYKYSYGTYEAGDGLTDYVYDVGDSIPVSFLLEQMIVNSDNTATNILSLGLGGKTVYKRQYTKYTDCLLTEEFYTENIITASIGYDFINYLYENQNCYEELIEYMKKSSYGEYLKKYVSCEVAHKYGSYNGYVHDYGIVYGDTTYLIGIFTKGVSEATELIADINEEICDNLTEMWDYFFLLLCYNVAGGYVICLEY